MTVSALQVSTYWIRFHQFEKFHLITLIFTLLLGGCTSIFHKAIFIKWKPTIVYWTFSIVLLSNHFFGKHILIRRMLEEKIELSPTNLVPFKFELGVIFSDSGYFKFNRCLSF